jgi:spore coat protein B
MIRKQMDSQSVESNDYLKSLVGKKVKVYRGGPESCEGRLLDVQTDYVALMPEQSNDKAKNNNAQNDNPKNNNSKNDNAIIYYNLKHVQSISENLKANSIESNLRNVQNIVQSINENIYSNLKQVQSISENLIANLKHVRSISKNSEANDVESNLRHILNIDENSKANSVEWSIDFDGHPELVSANNFTELLKKFIGSMIKVNQGGPESKKGIVLVVAGDYMALLTEDDGIVFYNITHIKSVSVQNTSQNIDQNIDQNTPHSNSSILNNYFNAINFDDIHAQSFDELFDYFAYKWVSINRGGPEAAEGILVQEEGEHYTLVNNDEVIRIYPYHIKSISIGTKGFLKQQQKQEQQEQQQQQNNETTENTNTKDWVMSNKVEDNSTADRDDHTSRRSSSQETIVVEVDRTSDREHHTKTEDNRTSDREQRTKAEDDRTSDREQRTKVEKVEYEVKYDRTSGREQLTSQRSSPKEKIVKETIVKTIDYIWDPKK